MDWNLNIKKIFIIILFVTYCHRPEVKPPEFSILSRCPLPGYPLDIDIKGNYAYIANDQAGLQIVDISNPESTFVIGGYLSQKNFQGVAVRDSLAYIAVAASDGGLMILNIKDPKNILFVGQDPSFYAYRIAAPERDTQFVYIAARYWFMIEDVSWPQYPSFSRRFSTPGNVHSLFVIDSFVYLACEQMGLIIYNLSNPDSTAMIGELDTPSNARGIFIKDGYAYIADGYDGLVIIDISDPYNPKFVSNYDTDGYAQGLFVEGNLVYVASGSGGLFVIDVSEKENPYLYGQFDSPYAYNLYVKNGLVYLLDRDLGLVIIKEANR